MKTCFSTDVVDLDHQSPNRNKRESKYYWDELYLLIHAAGFTHIEIPYEPKWDYGGRSGIPYTNQAITTKFDSVKNYRNFLKESGINQINSVHLNPSLFCNGNRAMYFAAFSHYAMEALEFAKEASADVLTLSVTPPYSAVHSLLETGMTFSQLEHEFLEETLKILVTVAKEAKKCGVSLCIKNEYWGLLRGEKIVSFLQKLQETCEVFLALDTAHLHIAGISIPSFIAKNHKLIGIVHFTDTSFIDSQDTYKQALPEFPAKKATKVFRDIGDGSIDFVTIYQQLENIDYQGALVYHCQNSYDVARSLLRTRSYIDRNINQLSLEVNYVKH